MRKDHWWVPLTGVAFVVCAIAGAIVSGEPPGADGPVQEIVSHYEDNKDAVEFGALLFIIAAALFVFFAGFMSKLLDREASGQSMLPTVAVVGSGIFATGAAIDATISFGLAEAVGDIDPTAVQALQALWDNDFMPLALGVAVFFLATGLGIVRYGGVPTWLGWIAVLLGVVALTPVGFVAFMAGGLWIVGVSVLLAVRGRKIAGGAGPPPADRADRAEPLVAPRA
jgi:hypothetical protein